MSKTGIPLYAVFRIDEVAGASVENMAERITVKEVVLTMEEADAEVERLNDLNRKKGCRYFWQSTKYVGGLGELVDALKARKLS